MTSVLVTGATGPLGRRIVEWLLRWAPTVQVAALCRGGDQLADLAHRGVSVRVADYFDPPSLNAAMADVDKLMLVSAPAFTDAVTAHHNVICAAKAAGVHHVHFSSIQRQPDSTTVIDQVTAWNTAAEDELMHSGMDVTILRNTLYADALDVLLGEPDEHGVIRVPAGHARAALATRSDIAAATAVVLAGDGHAGRTYDLAGSHPVDLTEIAAVIATAYGRPVTYRDVAVDAFVAARVQQGQPEPIVRFQADWFAAFTAGEFATTGAIEELLRRPPTDPLTYISRQRQTVGSYPRTDGARRDG